MNRSNRYRNALLGILVYGFMAPLTAQNELGMEGLARVSLNLSGDSQGMVLSTVSSSSNARVNYQTWRPEAQRRQGIDLEVVVRPDRWTPVSLSVRPEADGRLQITLLGPYIPEGKARKQVPMLYSGLRLAGAFLNNEALEKVVENADRTAKLPAGWDFWLPGNSAGLKPQVLLGRGYGGANAVLTWHDGVLHQSIPVKKGETLALSFWARKPNAMDLSIAEGWATCLDLRSQANMGFRDEVAGDGRGGWSDQGPDNDLRQFDFRQDDFGGVPFQVIDPESNGGSSVLSFRGARFSSALSEARLAPKAAVTARYLYLLHTTCYNSGKGPVGTVRVRLSGGAEKTFEVLSGRDVADWWGAGTVSNGAVVYRQPNRSSSVGLYLSRFDLGEALAVEAVTLATAGDSTWIVVGATLSARDLPLPKENLWRPQVGDQWKVIDLTDVQVVPGSALDFSRQVEEGPAGRFGAVQVLPGGGLAFEGRPKSPLRFFSFQILVNHLFEKRGANLAAATEEETRSNIDQWVALVRRQGYNQVRLQAVDLYLMSKATRDAEFNPVHHDRFEYLVSRLKAAGVYVGIDGASFIGYRAVGWTEGMAERNYERLLVEEGARKSWSEGVRRLLTHENPYTRTSLAKDPMVVYFTCFNEQDLGLGGNLTFNHPGFQPAALAKWRAYLAARYAGKQGLLAERWKAASAQEAAFYTSGDLAAGGERAEDICGFLFQLVDGMAAWYLGELKAIGYRGLVVQFDVLSQYLHHAVHCRTTAVANHGYHGHPSDKANPGSRGQQDGMIAGAGGYFRTRLAARFWDRPFFITEYGAPYWGRYRHEEGILFPAYAALQDIPAITVHAQAVILRHEMQMEDFCVGRDPISRAAQVMATRFFAPGVLRPSTHRVEQVLDDAWVFKGANALKAIESGVTRAALVCGLGLRYEGRPVPEGIPPAPKAHLSLRPERVGEVLATSLTATTAEGSSDTMAQILSALRARGILPAENRSDVERGQYESDTGEIFLETGIQRMSVASPTACGVAIKPGVTGKAGAILKGGTSTAAAIGLFSLDGLDIPRSRRLLLVYATDAVNSGHETSADRVVLKRLGTLPVLVETGKLELTFQREGAAAMKGHVLAINGARREPLSVAVSPGQASVRIDTAALASGPALYFELEATGP
ncbi:MAG: hypothetical protein J0L75_10290 [Spirochaetes bacterium]|nr:hypothetical protein [Spirochaetota bacterium]